MSWIEVRTTFSSELQDLSPMIELYREFGIENTLEDATTLTGCLVDVEGTDLRVQALCDALISAGAIEVSSHPLPEDNWEEAWKTFFKPRRVGRHLVIRPTWEEFDSGPADKVIVLDPGQAFGTGDHPTTRMCLQLLENAHVRGKRVLDLGCGSGILAIGASLLGASSVDATDIDPLAVEVAKQNAELNGVPIHAFVGEGLGALHGRQGRATGDVQHDETELDRSSGVSPSPVPSFDDPKRSYDVVVSNIISATLIRLSHEVAPIVRPGGIWIVSGIITVNWPDVKMSATSQGFDLVEMLEEDGWVAAGFVKF